MSKFKYPKVKLIFSNIKFAYSTDFFVVFDKQTDIN